MGLASDFTEEPEAGYGSLRESVSEPRKGHKDGETASPFSRWSLHWGLGRLIQEGTWFLGHVLPRVIKTEFVPRQRVVKGLPKPAGQSSVTIELV